MPTETDSSIARKEKEEKRRARRARFSNIFRFSPDASNQETNAMPGVPLTKHVDGSGDEQDGRTGHGLDFTELALIVRELGDLGHVIREEHDDLLQALEMAEMYSPPEAESADSPARPKASARLENWRGAVELSLDDHFDLADRLGVLREQEAITLDDWDRMFYVTARSYGRTKYEMDIKTPDMSFSTPRPRGSKRRVIAFVLIWSVVIAALTVLLALNSV